MKDTFNILGCAGGGLYGLCEILAIEQLEAAGQPVMARFDALGGTSAGAINTAPLAIGKPAAVVRTFYTEWAPRIFKPRPFDIEADLKFAPKYDHEQLTAALQTILMIDDAGGRRQATLRDCRTNWLGTSLDAGTKLPILFCSWMRSQTTRFGEIVGYDSPMEVWEMVIQSASAPTYFPGFETVARAGRVAVPAGGSPLLPGAVTRVAVDGGLTGANAVDSIMIHATRELANGSRVRMLSLGSGNTPVQTSGREMLNPSDFTVAKFVLGNLLGPGMKMAELGAWLALGHDYFHLEPTFPVAKSMDDLSLLQDIPPVMEALLAKNQATLAEFAA